MRTRATAWKENYKNSGTSTIKVSQGRDPDLRIQVSSRSLTQAKINEQVRGHKFRKDLPKFQTGVLWWDKGGLRHGRMRVMVR